MSRARGRECIGRQWWCNSGKKVRLFNFVVNMGHLKDDLTLKRRIFLVKITSQPRNYLYFGANNYT